MFCRSHCVQLFSPILCYFTYFLFVVQKPINLIRSNLFIFLLPWEPDIRKQRENFWQSMFPFIFRYEFVVWCLLFKPTSHLQFLFLVGVWVDSNFSDICDCPTSSSPVAVETFPHCIFLFLCQRLVDHRGVGLCLGSLLCSLVPQAWFCARTSLFWILQLCRAVWSLGGFCLLLCSWSSGLPWQFQVNFRNSGSSFVKMSQGTY